MVVVRVPVSVQWTKLLIQIRVNTFVSFAATEWNIIEQYGAVLLSVVMCECLAVLLGDYAMMSTVAQCLCRCYIFCGTFPRNVHLIVISSFVA